MNEQVHQPKKKSQAGTIALGIALLMSAAAVFIIFHRPGAPDPATGDLKRIVAYVDTQEFHELTLERRREYLTRLAESAADIDQFKQLPEEDRRLLKQAEQQQMMMQNFDNYFATEDQAKRDAILDKLIIQQQMQSMAMKGMKDYLKSTGKTMKDVMADSDRNGEVSDEERDRMQKMADRWNNNARREDPVMMAQVAEFQAAMITRMKQKGVWE